MEETPKEHDVRMDHAGWGLRARYTCYSEGCKEATVLEQPYMTMEQWHEALCAFLKEHPCSEPTLA